MQAAQLGRDMGVAHVSAASVLLASLVRVCLLLIECGETIQRAPFRKALAHLCVIIVAPCAA